VPQDRPFAEDQDGLVEPKVAWGANKVERTGADDAARKAGAAESFGASMDVPVCSATQTSNAASAAALAARTASAGPAIQDNQLADEGPRLGSGRELDNSGIPNEAAIAARKAEAEAAAWASGEPYYYEAWGCYVSVCGQYYQDEAYGGWRLLTEYGTDVQNTGQSSHVQYAPDNPAPACTANATEAGIAASTDVGAAQPFSSSLRKAHTSAEVGSAEGQADAASWGVAGISSQSPKAAAHSENQGAGADTSGWMPSQPRSNVATSGQNDVDTGTMATAIPDQSVPQAGIPWPDTDNGARLQTDAQALEAWWDDSDDEHEGAQLTEPANALENAMDVGAKVQDDGEKPPWHDAPAVAGAENERPASPSPLNGAAQPLQQFMQSRPPPGVPFSVSPTAQQVLIEPYHSLVGLKPVQGLPPQHSYAASPFSDGAPVPAQPGLATAVSNASAWRPIGVAALAQAQGRSHSIASTPAAAPAHASVIWHTSNAQGAAPWQVEQQNGLQSLRAASEGVATHWQPQLQNTQAGGQHHSFPHKVLPGPASHTSIPGYAAHHPRAAPAMQAPWQARGTPVSSPVPPAYLRPGAFQSQASWSPQQALPRTASAPVHTHAPRTVRDALTSGAGRPPICRLSMGIGGRVAYLGRPAPTYDHPDPSITLCPLSFAHYVAAGMPAPATHQKQPSALVCKHITDWPGPMNERAPASKQLAGCISASAKAAAAVGNHSLATLWCVLGVMAQYKGCVVGGEGEGKGPSASAAILKVLREAFGPAEGSCTSTARLCSGCSLMPPAVDAAATARQAELALLAGDKESALQITMQGKVRLFPNDVT
jgi:hypothetical protein